MGAKEAPADKPPPWLQTLLNQSKQFKQMLKPVLQHVAERSIQGVPSTTGDPIPNPGLAHPPLAMQDNPEPPSIQPHTLFTADPGNPGPPNASTIPDPKLKA